MYLTKIKSKINHLTKKRSYQSLLISLRWAKPFLINASESFGFKAIDFSKQFIASWYFLSMVKQIPLFVNAWELFGFFVIILSKHSIASWYL